MTSRKLSAIAFEISNDWGEKINYGERPYLNAMYRLSSIDDMYHTDTAKSIVRYFLTNASTWRGDTAKRIKAELKNLLK